MRYCRVSQLRVGVGWIRVAVNVKGGLQAWGTSRGRRIKARVKVRFWVRAIWDCAYMRTRARTCTPTRPHQG